MRLDLRPFAALLIAGLLALPMASLARAQSITPRAAQRDRGHHQRLPDDASRAAAGGDERAGEAPGRGRGGEASQRRQGARRDHLQFAAPGDGRQPAGRRHDRRVLRLQLRLLQTRNDGHARPDQGRSEAQVRPEGISGARRGLGAGRSGRRRRAHAGQDRQEIPRVPPEAARPAAVRSTRRARSRSPRRSVSIRRGSRRTWRATRSRRRSRRA